MVGAIDVVPRTPATARGLLDAHDPVISLLLGLDVGTWFAIESVLLAGG